MAATVFLSELLQNLRSREERIQMDIKELGTKTLIRDLGGELSGFGCFKSSRLFAAGV
jgi:hypothetical protein